MTTPFMWLASYPRSGNTFLRTIIYQCFGIRSASIYPRDLGTGSVADMVGHIERQADRSIDFGDEPLALVKTHQPPPDNRPAIYVIRDGREATVSLFEFYGRRIPLRSVVEGRHRFGTWASHVEQWHPHTRDRTLLLRYEQMVADLRGAIDQVADFLQLAPKSYTVPSRAEMARADGVWIRSEDIDRPRLDGDDLARFWELNGDVMRRYGYAKTPGESEQPMTSR